MKTYKFIPKACDDVLFSGHILMRKPRFNEKYDLIESLNLNQSDQDNINSGIRKLRELIDICKQYVISVDIKNLETGEEFKSFDDLFDDIDCEDILIELGTKFLGGFRTKNS